MKRLKRILVILLILSFMPYTQAYGESRPKAADIPEKTLIIGSYLINLSAMNNEVLNLAQKSAEKEMQFRIFFKSDINKGVWYDITDGGDITNIAVTTNNIVSNGEIDGLNLTHYAKSSGQIIEFSSGNSVAISSIAGINFPPNLPELDEVVKEAEIISSILANIEGDSDEDNRKKDIYSREFASASYVLLLIDNDTFKQYTERLNILDEFIAYVRNSMNGGNGIIELAVTEKGYISAEREQYCYSIVNDRINLQLELLDYQEDTTLIQKYSDALTAIAERLLELESEKKQAPVNSLEKVYGKYSNAMLSLAFSRSFGGAYENLIKMNAINNLRIEAIEDKALEIQMAKEIKGDIFKNLSGSIAGGGSTEYKNAVASNEGRAVQEKLMEDSVLEYELYMEELNTAANYIIIRTDSSNGKAIEARELQEEYALLIESLEDGALKDGILQVLSNELAAATENATQLMLEASADYTNAKENTIALQAEVNNLNQKYLGAIEENETANAEEYKKTLDDTINKLSAAEAAQESISRQLKEREMFYVSASILNKDEADLKGQAEAAVKIIDGALHKINENEKLKSDAYIDEQRKQLEAIKSDANGIINNSINLSAVDALYSEVKAKLDNVKAALADTADNLNSAAGNALYVNAAILNIDESDLKGQAEAAVKIIDEALHKINENEKLKSDTYIDEQGKRLEEIKNDANDIINNSINLSAENALYSEVKAKLDNVKAALAVTADNLNSAAANALNQPVAPIVPPEASLLPESSDAVISSHLEKYSENDVKTAQEAVKSIGAAVTANKGEALEPWKLIFSDYNVKLRSPVIKYGNDIYVPAGELAAQMGSSVIGSKSSNAVVIKDKGVLIEFTEGDKFVYINDRREAVNPGIHKIGNQIYIPLWCFEKAYRLSSVSREGYTVVSKKL